VRLGRPAGPVRPPLVDPSGEDIARLRRIIEDGLALV
jgi:dihydrodipicolinate synthase/N-acetylneuraminate lyase